MKARKIVLCVDRFTNPGRRIWGVKCAGKWTTARTVRVHVPVVTVFKGQHAKQPRAYLVARGIVKTDGRGTVHIVAA